MHRERSIRWQSAIGCLNPFTFRAKPGTRSKEAGTTTHHSIRPLEPPLLSPKRRFLERPLDRVQKYPTCNVLLTFLHSSLFFAGDPTWLWTCAGRTQRVCIREKSLCLHPHFVLIVAFCALTSFLPPRISKSVSFHLPVETRPPPEGSSLGPAVTRGSLCVACLSLTFMDHHPIPRRYGAS